MTTTAEPLRCDKCHRCIRVQPVWWFGKPYGTTCVKRYGLAPERRIRVKRPKESEIQQPVLDGLEEEINENGVKT